MANPLRPALAALALTLALTGCGSDGSDGSDPATAGPQARAEEQLHDLGLTEAQATCMVEALGADTVVEATDLTALAQSQEYRDAADTCIHDD